MIKRFMLTVVVTLIFSATAFGQSPSDFRFQFENGEIHLTEYNGTETDVIIFATTGIKYIDAFAFTQGSTKITSVVIPDTVTFIGESAFMGNELTNVILPNTITTIERLAFMSNKLTHITIPDSITSIGNFAFARNSIITITAPSGFNFSGFEFGPEGRDFKKLYDENDKKAGTYTLNEDTSTWSFTEK
ncbi:hypothetical protein FACS1894172_19940 [Spirochaetia bacterium]|nr:hypothetical protein FACS1894164_19940 [Spirochaetia bacterium]GHU36825.1 hypothetical protein FACS1894172_19940 [Spirochaetia bacterium]